MLKSDNDDFTAAIRRHFATLGRAEPALDVVREFWDALKRYDLADVLRAIAKHRDSADHPATPKQLLTILRANREDEAPDHRCVFHTDGDRCPLRGQIEVAHGNPTAGRYCVGHDELRRDRLGSAAYLRRAIDKALPYCPTRTEALLARALLEDGNAQHIAPQFGPGMLPWLKAHQHLTTRNRPWPLSTFPGARDVAVQIATETHAAQDQPPTDATRRGLRKPLTAEPGRKTS